MVFFWITTTLVLFLHFNPITWQVCGPEGFDKSLSNPGTPHYLDSPPGLLNSMDQETKDQGPRTAESFTLKILSAKKSNILQKPNM